MFRPTAEERLNTATHGIGLVLSVAGAVLLLHQVVSLGDIWRNISGGLYAASLVGVYASSTLSHGVSQPDWKRWFRQLDQAFIYLLIVSSFTPFVLVYLRSSGWIWFLAGLWLIAVGGFLSKLVIAHRVDAVSLWLYLLLGWLPITSTGALLGLAPTIALWLILLGGLCYTVGTVFLMLDQRVPLFHAVWHLLVIAGSALHFMAVRYVLADSSFPALQAG